ncbi:MAG: NAD-dependent epimerase/dehydratase family protein [Acidobacteria bacterium]|nr:NAD-dependent epimerase/dehydratase family protein [Acidobacteriota bacterium]
MARFFVTGATGFLGGELVKQLIGRGHQVVALVRSLDRATLLSAMGVELHTGDITNRESLRTPMRSADGVFHVAAWYKLGVRDSSGIAERVNVDGTRYVLDMARELAIQRVVYTSTVSVFGDTYGKLVNESYSAHGPFLTEYDRSKWRAHYDVAVPLMQAGLPLIIVMPGAIYGPGDTSAVHRTLVRLLRGRLLMTPKGVTFCWGYVEDIARGLRQAMDAGRVGESYLLTGPAHTFQDVFATAARIVGRRPPPLHPPRFMMRAAASLAALLEKWDFRAPYPAEVLRLMAGTTWIATSAKAEGELGFTARPLDEGLRHTIEHELRQLGMS